MRNELLSLGTIVLFVFIGNAQEKNDLNQKHEFKCGSIITSHNNEVIEYKFKSLDNLSEEIEEIIKEFDFNNSENIKDVCEIMIELKLEIVIGVTTVLISETIKTNCGTEAKKLTVGKLKAMIIVAAIE